MLSKSIVLGSSPSRITNLKKLVKPKNFETVDGVSKFVDNDLATLIEDFDYEYSDTGLIKISYLLFENNLNDYDISIYKSKYNYHGNV